MKKSFILGLLLFVAALTVDFEMSEGTFVPAITASTAEATVRPYHGQARRVARRTARRTTRRTAARWAYYSHLPAGGCYWVSWYYNCAGVYYQPVVEDGVTVYVIVED